MTLRRQLLLVSLLLLTLPWAGCQFLREIEGTLRRGQQQALEATVRAVASSLRDQPRLLYPQGLHAMMADGYGEDRPPIYASPGRAPLIMDGYADGWGERDYARFSSTTAETSLSVAYQAVTRGDRLYLLLRINDPEPVYDDPGLADSPNGDRLLVRTAQGGRPRDYLVAPVAPGSVRARFATRRERGTSPTSLRGYWQDAPGGYSVELEMPLSFTGERLGIAVLSVAAGTREIRAVAGNVEPTDRQLPPRLIRTPEGLQQALQPYRSGGGPTLQVVDRQGWLIGHPPGDTTGRPATDAGKATARADADAGTSADAHKKAGAEVYASAPLGGTSDTGRETFWLMRWLYRAILEQPAPAPATGAWGKARGAEIDLALAGHVASQWYRASDGANDIFLSAAAPINVGDTVAGAVIARQSSEEYLSLTDRAFSQLFSVTIAALSVAVLGLLGFATLISWRIRRLSRAAAEAVGDGGELTDSFPRSRARDEIGELSRSYASLLDQVRGYHEYLRGLSRKLAHELRTPIAVIQSSLDNLDLVGNDPETAASYRQRARHGLTRLNAILTAMSEATQLEDSLRNNPLQQFDLVPVLHEIGSAYQGAFPTHRVQLSITPEYAPVNGTPELLVQALDKLMDNAAAFSPPGGTIEIALSAGNREWLLTVDNEGPPLPTAFQEQLFEPMVSHRDGGSPSAHMGLGLHIVQLICRAFGGSAAAANRPGGDGVTVTLRLPRGG